MARNARKLKFNKLMKEVLSNELLQDEIVRMITIDQLYELGEDGQGRSLGDYAHATIYGTANFEGKIQKGQRYDHITLNDTGKFYDSFRVVLRGDSLIVTADTMKGGKQTEYQFDQDARGNLVLANKVRTRATDLATEFGRQILELNEENLKILIRQVKIDFVIALRKALFA